MVIGDVVFHIWKPMCMKNIGLALFSKHETKNSSFYYFIAFFVKVFFLGFFVRLVRQRF